MIFRKVHRLAALRVYTAVIEKMYFQAWPNKDWLARHFLRTDPEYCATINELCCLEDDIKMTIKFTSLKKLYAFQNKLHARGYKLDDYDEFYNTENWKKDNKIIVLLMEA